jgi:NitT/TauT family transport system substrate-binding protein
MKRRMLAAAIASLVLLAPAGRAQAQQAHELRVGIGFGIGFLPFFVAEAQHLFESQAQAAGAGPITVTYPRFSGSSAMQDAILSGNVDIGGYGVPALLIAWDRARNTPLQVQGIAGVTTTPLILVTNRADFRTLSDIAPSDRISMPALVSPQMYVLQLAAERAFGAGQQDRLRGQVVALPHPESVNALLSGTELTAYFSSAPFTQLLLRDPRIHAVLNSEEVFGGPASFLAIGGTRRFVEANPQLVTAIVATMDGAARFIHDHPREAAEIYLAKEPNRATDVEFIQAILRDPQTGFGAEVRGVKAYADFMARIGQLRNPPARWEDVFVPIQGRPGS